MKGGVRGKSQDGGEKKLSKHFQGQVLQHSELPMCPSRTWEARQGHADEISFTSVPILLTILTPPTSSTETDP